MTIKELWNTDAPEGKCWKCPDCFCWSSLGGNAAFHSDLNNHRLPTLENLPSQTPTDSQCLQWIIQHSASIKKEKDGWGVFWSGFSSGGKDLREVLHSVIAFTEQNG